MNCEATISKAPILGSWATGSYRGLGWQDHLEGRKRQNFSKTKNSHVVSFLLKCTRTLFFFTLETEMDAIDAMPCRASFGFEKIR